MGEEDSDPRHILQSLERLLLLVHELLGQACSGELKMEREYCAAVSNMLAEIFKLNIHLQMFGYEC